MFFMVVTAPGFHLFPSRTEKLSPAAPMVLHTRGRVGRRHFFESSSLATMLMRNFFLCSVSSVLVFCCWLKSPLLPPSRRCGISLAEISTIFHDDAHYLRQRSTVSLKVRFWRAISRSGERFMFFASWNRLNSFRCVWNEVFSQKVFLKPKIL